MYQEKSTLQPMGRVSSVKANNNTAAAVPALFNRELVKTVADDFASPPPKASFSEANPMAAAARRSSVTSRSSSFSLSISISEQQQMQQQALSAAVSVSPTTTGFPVIAARPRRQSSVGTIQQQQMHGNPMSRGNGV